MLDFTDLMSVAYGLISFVVAHQAVYGYAKKPLGYTRESPMHALRTNPPS